MTTRRERQRAELAQEIKDTARRLMAEHGTAGVSLRMIAREMDMSAPSLYHYFENYDALITALLVDAFNALANELERVQAIPDHTPLERLEMAVRNVRTWALAHPIDFQLIYGNPIPGYHAPREVTVPAVVRGYVLLGQLLDAALAQSDTVPSDGFEPIPPTIEAHLTAMRAQYNYNVSTFVLYSTQVLWTRMYGILMLELYHHIQPAVGDSAAFYNAQMEHTFRSIGLKH